jgi:AraC-like DNA-binding protein
MPLWGISIGASLDSALIQQKLEALLDGQKVETIAFRPMFDQTRGAGATIRRMFDFLFAELEHPDTLLTNKIAIRSFEENLALCLLLGLPHNYTERLGRQKAAAAPGNVRRAEAFMRANAGQPLTIAEIAEAARCGVRALQIAFYRFRGATPMRVLQQARLEQARTEMLRPGQRASLAHIAAEYGFSSPTRFAQSFRRKYGVNPSEMVRERGHIRAG